ncbi:MAG: FAD-binding oxidoreductase [Pseudomonadota bacterium]
MSKTSRRAFLLGTGALLGGWGAHKYHTDPIPVGTTLTAPMGDPLLLNDASELSPTKVAKHLTISDKFDAQGIAALRAELKEAEAQSRPVIASAARHSMGGQSLAQGGTTFTFDHDWMELDTQALTFRTGAGTRWSTVISTLDAAGFSPAVMQSNNDFGVAATFSVNAHGWPVPFGPMGHTVRSIQIMLADGQLVTASREENADIFLSAMGGYGLIGIITEMEIDMVPNARLEPTYQMVEPLNFGPEFVRAIKGITGVQMAYGRMDISKDHFLEEAMMITYRPTADQSDLPPAPGSGWLSRRARDIFRAQLGSDIAKHGRWWFESSLGPRIGGGETTRNTLLNEPVITLDDRDPTRTDILHEYFIAPENFGAFIAACRDIIPSSYQELLNITLRYVQPDSQAWLGYAPVERIAAVMLFSQEKSLRAEEDAKRMTQALIDAAIRLGGTYYLPYRLHARPDQIAAGYAGLRPFAAKKRAMDPKLLFRNALWDQYIGRV